MQYQNIETETYLKPENFHCMNRIFLILHKIYSSVQSITMVGYPGIELAVQELTSNEIIENVLDGLDDLESQC